MSTNTLSPEELKVIEAIPIYMAAMGQNIEQIKTAIRPEWCIRRETAQMYQVIKTSPDVVSLQTMLCTYLNDEYVVKAMRSVDILTVSVSKVAAQIRDGYHRRESDAAVSAYLNSTTPSARRFNLKRLEKLEDEMTDNAPIEGLETIDMSNRSPAIEYCLKSGEVMWAPRKEVTAIKGRAKNGKTNLLAIMMAAMIGRCAACGIDVANHEQQLRILYVDTEQGMWSSEHIIEKAMQMAGFDPNDNIAQLSAINLRKTPKRQRKTAIERYVSTGQYDVVIVDGIKDLCYDFNDLKESDELMVDVLSLVDTFNVSFITVLHENPSGDNGKMRGHLGTEVENKAFEVLESKRVDDVFNVSNTERRAKMIPTFAFRFNEDDELEVCEPNVGRETTSQGPLRPTKEEKEAKLWNQFRKAWEDNPNLSLTQQEICDNLAKKCGMKTTTAKRRIEDYLAQGKIYRDGEGRGARFYPSPAEMSQWAIERQSAAEYLEAQKALDNQQESAPF